MVSRFKQEYHRLKPYVIMVKDAICPICDRKFNGKTDYKGNRHNFGRKYCSEKCRKLARKKYNRKYFLTNKDKYRKYALSYREDILSHYGYKCSCCSVKEDKFLTIDHIKRFHWGIKGKMKNPYDEYRRIKKEGYPDNIQILCMNCNFAKAKYENKRYCPVHHPEEYTIEELNK